MSKPAPKDPWRVPLLAWAVLMTVLYAATLMEPRGSGEPAGLELVESAEEARFVALPEGRETAAVVSSDYSGYAAAPPPVSAYGCAENGSCYGDLSQDTGRPRTVHVDGYFRSDGAYVRGHYRSAPR